MPFYEYQCKSCGHELEAMQKVSDDPLKKCPHCGKSQLQRLISAPVFRLKGGGWYETDFKNDKDNKRNLADRPESDVAKDSDTKKTESTDSKSADTGTATAETKPQSKDGPVKADSKKAAKRPSPAKKSGAAKPRAAEKAGRRG